MQCNFYVTYTLPLLHFRSNEIKAKDRFVQDADAINNKIKKICGKVPFHEDMFEDLQDEFDDLKRSEEMFENLLLKSR